MAETNTVLAPPPASSPSNLATDKFPPSLAGTTVQKHAGGELAPVAHIAQAPSPGCRTAVFGVVHLANVSASLKRSGSAANTCAIQEDTKQHVFSFMLLCV